MEDRKVSFPAKASDDLMPEIPIEGEPQKKREGFEFVYADIVGSWSFSPETFVRMDDSEKQDVMPGQFGFLIHWGVKNYGFGEYKVRFFTNGTIQVEDECSGPEFSKALFAYLGEQVAAKGEHDHDRDERNKRKANEIGEDN